MSPDDPRHGEERGYFAHRKAGQKPCDDCARGHSAASKRRALQKMAGNPALLSAIGTQRRIRALSAIGWPLGEISSHLGRTPRHEGIASLLKQTWVHAETAARVDKVYRALCMTPGPNSAVAARARNKGWAPPLAWDNIDDLDEKPVGLTIVPANFPEEVRPNGRPVVVDCGTERGYQQHRNLWRTRQIGSWPLPADDPCGCRSAHRIHERARSERSAA